MGIDPTAPSLHVGHLLPLMSLFWMFVHGFHAITLVRKLCLESKPVVVLISLYIARRCHCPDWRSYRKDDHARATTLYGSESQHGLHALPAQDALGKYGASCPVQTWISVGMGVAQRACEQ